MDAIFPDSALGYFAALFIFIIGLAAALLVVVYIHDITQRRHTVLRNYPVVGHLRYWFEDLGHFFRQYFFAFDREERPFNRAERTWVYRASKNLDNTVPFGSTRDLQRPGTVLFANDPFPVLEGESSGEAIRIGPYCTRPYDTASLVNISAMSYGALSRPAVQALGKGAATAGCWLNTGEGGLSDHHLESGADLVFQIGTAKYGVRDEAGRLSEERLRAVAAHDQVRMFEIKLSQGAKPGKGGILPAAKVTEEIAAIRGIPAGESSISPNRHPEIDSPAALLDFIARVRDITGKPVGIKMVIGSYGWMDELFGAIRARGPESAPDFITVDGAEGGTGAAPMSLIDAMGLSLRETLPVVVDKLAQHGLRERVRVIASGRLLTPVEAAWALASGADFIATARGFLFALGCIQALKCNQNSCPTGITTHDPKLQRGLDPADKAVRVCQYAENLTRELSTIAHACGVAGPRELRRHHVRQVMADGRSIALDRLYPETGRATLSHSEETHSSSSSRY